MINVFIQNDIRYITVDNYTYREDLTEYYHYDKYRVHTHCNAIFIVETSYEFTEFNEYPLEIIHCHLDGIITSITLYGELDLELMILYNTDDKTNTYFTNDFVIYDIQYIL